MICRISCSVYIVNLRPEHEKTSQYCGIDYLVSDCLGNSHFLIVFVIHPVLSVADANNCLTSLSVPRKFPLASRDGFCCGKFCSPILIVIECLLVFKLLREQRSVFF